MEGHERAYYSDDHPSYNKSNRSNRSSHTVHALLKDDFLKEFIVIFLARTYLKEWLFIVTKKLKKLLV